MEFREERRSELRKQKRMVLYFVALAFLLAEIVSERYAWFDHLSHLAVLAYLGARTFIREI